jgi:hypothetical protein
MNMIVWNAASCLDYVHSCYMGIDWFPDAEVITDLHKPAHIETDTRLKIVMFNLDFSSLAQDLSWADLIILYSKEILDHSDHASYFTQQYSNPNVIFIVGGINSNTVKQSPGLFWPVLTCMHSVASVNTDVSYDTSRPFLFEALMGNNKKHRQLVFDSLGKHLLLQHSIVSLSSGQSRHPDYASDILDRLDLPIATDFRKARHPADVIDWLMPAHGYSYDFCPGIPVPLSDIIATDVYNNSWYSIVTETNAGAGYRFLTEKTAKPLFGKRIFVCFSSQGHLELLRQQGYETFHRIVDESYDSIPEDEQRWLAAWQQVLALSESDPAITYARCADIIKHNHDHIKHNIRQNYKQISTFVQSHICRLL